MKTEGVGQKVGQKAGQGVEQEVETDGEMGYGLTMKTTIRTRIRKGFMSLVAKIKDTITLQPRTGKWIPVNCKLDSKSNNNFLYPIIFNSFIERNIIISKFSPQAGATRSPAIYMYNSNDFFVQVRKGDSVARLISLEVKGRGRAEDRRMRD